MKILYIATSFPPPHKGETIYTDLACALREAGHSVTVVVPEGSSLHTKTLRLTERGLDVLRVVVGEYYNVSFLKKGITTLKMPFMMKRAVKKELIDMGFDLVLFESPPVTSSSLVAYCKKLFCCPSFLMLKDIFPQNAVDLGIIKKGSPLHWYFARQEKRLYAAADTIGCMSKGNREYVLAHNPALSPERVVLFPNTKRISPLARPKRFPERERLGIPAHTRVFLFGGNMGRPQFVDLLCKGVKACKDDENIFLLFVGRGTERGRIQKAIEESGAKNALLVDNLPRDQYEALGRECDAGLVILNPRFTIPNYPSRILSYMENAIPVLAATDRNTDFKALIEESGCGIWCWSGDEEGFVAALRQLAVMPKEALDAMGRRGRVYLEEHFDVSRSVRLLEQYAQMK